MFDSFEIINYTPSNPVSTTMRKITDHKFHKPAHIPNKPIVPIFTQKLPIDLLPLLSKYHKRFYSLIKIFTFCKSKTSTNSKICKKHIERHMCHYDNAQPKLIITHFINLETYEIVGAKLVDFTYLHNCNLRKLEMTHVNNIKIHHNLKLNIKKIVLKNLVITKDIFIKIMNINLLESVLFGNVRFEDDRIPDYFYNTLNIKNLKSIKIIDKIGKNVWYNKIRIDNLESFMYKNDDVHFEFNKSQTNKNMLCIMNCDNYIYDLDYSLFFNITIKKQCNVDRFLDVLNICRLNKLTVSECLFDDNVLEGFLGKFDYLEELDLSKTHLASNRVLFILKKFGQTLRVLNLSNIKLNVDIMEKARKYLKCCKLIYNENRVTIIRN